MKARVLKSSLSVAILATSLTGCATLEARFAAFKPSTTTTPEQMDQTVSFPQREDETVSSTANPPNYAEIEQSMPALIMDGQMKPRPANLDHFERPSMSGFQAVNYANAAAIVEPQSDNYLNAIQLYPYTPGSLYQVYTSPTQVTDIALEKGEGLTSVSAGDTERWTVGDTVSGSGADEQVHILVKPMAPRLSTNAVITTTKRTYYLDLKSFADTYMAAVSWRYPHDIIKQISQSRQSRASSESVRPQEAPIYTPDTDNLRFDYTIKGDAPNWRPVRVFDDHQKVFIEFPQSLVSSEAPPLFVTDEDGELQKLVNYRVRGDYYIVDRLFDYAELRLGEKSQSIVRIERET